MKFCTWQRATTSKCLAKISTSFPFPSSPHWQPSTPETWLSDSIRLSPLDPNSSIAVFCWFLSATASKGVAEEEHLIVVAAGAFKVILKWDPPNGCLPPWGAWKLLALFWAVNGTAAADALVEIGLASSLREEEEDERFMVVAAVVAVAREWTASVKLKLGRKSRTKKKGFKGFWESFNKKFYIILLKLRDFSALRV